MSKNFHPFMYILRYILKKKTNNNNNNNKNRTRITNTTKEART